jgi:outer membrane protein assembly factor BamE (lipoprotein component of BamABCDE complex)
MGIMGQVLDEKMKRIIFCLFGLLLPLGGCYYTVHSTEGRDISTAQIQQIKLGKTTEADLFKILGLPSKRERKPDGTISLLYVYSQEKSPTVLGGFVFEGIVEKAEDTFEITLKDGVVRSYHFLRE